MLDAAGPFAHPIATLSWGLFGLALFVALVVGAALWLALKGPAAWRSRLGGERAVLALGLAFPTIVLTALLVWGLSLTAGLSEPGPKDPVVRVTGQQWWWRVHYLDGAAAGLIEANEIHIPVGRPVTLELDSIDVIHSFWIPRLAGKLDMIPGRRNRLRVQADAPGTYRGQCAEYCGGAHALMAVAVVAHTEADYAAWAAARRRPAAAPANADAARGQALFLSGGCPMCHTVRGTLAGGGAGPDLTHVGSRLSLAAGALPNDRGGFGAWIAGVQSIKPGARMPQYAYAGRELSALTAYLEGLQ